MNSPQSSPKSWNKIALIVAGIAIVLAIGLVIAMVNRPLDDEPPAEEESTTEEAPAPSPSEAESEHVPDDVQALLDRAVANAGGPAAIAVVGAVAGDDSAYPTWSTIKVPIAIAALHNDPGQAHNASAAITVSDNAAAEAMFTSLPDGAADAVMNEAGVPVPVNKEKIRAEFSIFGQTLLSTSQEATLASNLRCVEGSEQVIELMGQIAPDQSYGLGQLPGARFKGGWGPDTAGAYQVRQFGLVSAPQGDVAIAMTALPPSGTYGEGQTMLNTMASEISSELELLPKAAC